MLAALAEVESNDTLQSAQVVSIATGDVNLLTSDQWLNVDGAISTTTDQDYYRFNITEPSGVFLDVEAFNIGAPGNLNSAITLFNSTGGIINNGVNDDGYSFINYEPPVFMGSTASPSLDPALYMDLQPGTYTLRVTGTKGTSGDYSLLMLADSNYSSTVPVFNSYPSATDTFYLDFDGFVGRNDYWAINGPYVATPYDFDGVPSQYSPSERLAIQTAFLTAAEDYSPFNVNISTVEPSSFEDGEGMRMVVTSSFPSIVGLPTSTLGVALDSAYSVDFLANVAFTFESTQAKYAVSGQSGQMIATAIDIGNTISHELGHTLGLDHYTGLGLDDYNAIMSIFSDGVQRLVWANTLSLGGPQDDVAVIADVMTNTFGYRADDHGDTTATASPLSTSATGFASSGVIEGLMDKDYFSFTLTPATAGSVTIRADINVTFNDLDTTLALYDSTGALLGSNSPSSSYSSSITQTLAAGTYYVEVGSQGDHGELGQYDVSVTTPVAPIPQSNYDFGDAPNSYLTTLASDGPRHLVTGPVLGATRDTEFDGQPSSGATGDGADEDGVAISSLIIGQAATATVTVSVAPGLVDAWIDFNRDGVFDPVGERITTAAGAAVRVGSNTLNFTVPAGAVAGATFARFRISSGGGLAPSGVANNGEVEDYLVTITTQGGNPIGVGVNGLDIVGISNSGEILVGRSNGQTFVNETYGLFAPSLGLHDIATGDFDGDGLADIIGRTVAGDWVLAHNTGSSFVQQAYGTWYEAVGWLDVTVGNFAGDALPDVIGRTASGQWWLGVNDGTGFVNQLFGFWDGSAGWRDVMTGDFDSNGTLDVVGRTSTGQWWLGASDGTTLANQPFGAWTESAGWRDVASADFNADGRADVVGRTSTGGWWMGLSTAGGFVNSSFGGWAEEANWQDVMVGDYSGDGIADVIGRTAGGDWWLGVTNFVVGVFVNQRFGNWGAIASGNPWRGVTQGDFNNDGWLDIVGRDGNSGRWWLGSNNGAFLFSSQYGSWDESQGWHDVHAGAFSADASLKTSKQFSQVSDAQVAAAIFAQAVRTSTRQSDDAAHDAAFANELLYDDLS